MIMFPEMKIVKPPDIHWNSFKLLYKDLEESFRWVHPNIEHLSVYSLRFYELFIRASTEFESLCKAEVTQRKLSKTNPKSYTIKDYYLLNDYFESKPSKISVGFIFAEPIFVKPLMQWETSHSLGWYKDYNQVKHNKAQHFSLATLSNVLHSIAALFIIIERCRLCTPGKLSFLEKESEYSKILSGDDWGVVIRKDY